MRFAKEKRKKTQPKPKTRNTTQPKLPNPSRPMAILFFSLRQAHPTGPSQPRQPSPPSPPFPPASGPVPFSSARPFFFPHGPACPHLPLGPWSARRPPRLAASLGPPVITFLPPPAIPARTSARSAQSRSPCLCTWTNPEAVARSLAYTVPLGASPERDHAYSVA